jgi:hypothetical protein
VSLGPFADYKSRLFSGSAGELFEFADPESVVSKRYEDALRIAMKYGVRVTYCGSIDDQLVSMEVRKPIHSFNKVADESSHLFSPPQLILISTEQSLSMAASMRPTSFPI